MCILDTGALSTRVTAAFERKIAIKPKRSQAPYTPREFGIKCGLMSARRGELPGVLTSLPT